MTLERTLYTLLHLDVGAVAWRAWSRVASHFVGKDEPFFRTPTGNAICDTSYFARSDVRPQSNSSLDMKLFEDVHGRTYPKGAFSSFEDFSAKGGLPF